MMDIYPVLCNKKQYLDLLLLADEQESMIDRYLERGEMFVLAENSEVKAACVVTEEGKGIYEIKNIAVYPQFQHRGYGKRLIFFFWSTTRLDVTQCLSGPENLPKSSPSTSNADLSIHTGYLIFYG